MYDDDGDEICQLVQQAMARGDRRALALLRAVTESPSAANPSMPSGVPSSPSTGSSSMSSPNFAASVPDAEVNPSAA
jgi:hypothetical protein